MKQFFSYIFPILFLCLSSCEKVVDVNLSTIAPKLVIDASFEVLFNKNPVTTNAIVKLRLSADYFNETIPEVTNATVFLTNTANNTIIPFSDANGLGNYTPDVNFIPEENTEYELTVIYDGETYKATATRIKSTPLTSVVQGDGTLFSGNETELKIAFTDNGSENNYYLFNYTNNLFSTIDDRFFNGTDYTFSFFYQEDEIELPTNVTITLSGISEEYFTYFRVLVNQSGQNSGGPFQTIPSTLLGNIVNTTNEANFPLGYFHISETDTISLELIEKE